MKMLHLYWFTQLTSGEWTMNSHSTTVQVLLFVPVILDLQNVCGYFWFICFRQNEPIRIQYKVFYIISPPIALYWKMLVWKCISASKRFFFLRTVWWELLYDISLTMWEALCNCNYLHYPFTICTNTDLYLPINCT